MGDNSHAQSVAAMLRAAEEDDDLDDDLREKAGERADELEEEVESPDAGDHVRAAIDPLRDAQTDLNRAVEATDDDAVQEAAEEMYEVTQDLIETLGELGAAATARKGLDDEED